MVKVLKNFGEFLCIFLGKQQRQWHNV